jgi:2,3-bisphosphoglycerate-dependent phosphoglycerate mutase
VLDLWLVRHGQTTWNAEGRFQGHMDAPLSDLGVRQVKTLAERLARKHFDTIYSSDSGRAVQTAKMLFPDKDLLLDKRLREMHQGTLEGKTRVEFTPEQEAAYLAYKRDPFRTQKVEGENWQQLSQRVNDWINSLPESRSIVAVTHGGVVRAALWWLVGQATSYKWNARIDNASITRFHISSEQKLLITFNDAAHLEGVEECDD